MAADSVGSVSMSLKLDPSNFKAQLNQVVSDAVQSAKKQLDGLTSGIKIDPGKIVDKDILKPLYTAQDETQKKAKETTAVIKKEADSLGGLASKAKGLMKILGIGISIAGLLSFGKACVNLGSDLAEVQNVVNVVYGDMSDSVDDFAKSAMKAYGLSETVAKNYMGTLGSMSKAFGYSEQEAYDQAASLTALAGDMASFYNKTTDETFSALKAVYSGETEALKQYGVVMTETALNEFAISQGIGKTVSAMSEQEKVSLRLAFVQDRLTSASGDFARTSGGWANQVRVLSLSFDSFRASIGQGLINVLTPVVQWLNAIMEAANSAAQAFANFTASITGVNQEVTSGIAAGTAAAAESAKDLNSGIKTAGGSAKKAVKQLAGFDKLNILSKQSSGGGGGGGGGSGLTKSIAPPKGILDSAKAQLSKYAGIINDIKNACDPTIQSLQRLWNDGLSKLGGFVWQGLKDFWEHFLVPVGSWVMGEGLPHFIDTLNSGLSGIDWDSINSSLTSLWDALAPFMTETIGEGLLWIWDNVLVPLGSWTLNEVVPRFFTTLSLVISIVNSILQALKPIWEWFWDNVLEPITKWVAGAFITIWNGIIKILTKFSDWCKTHKKTIQTITKIVIAFIAAWEFIKIAAFINDCGGIVGALITVAAQLGITGAATSAWAAITTFASGVATTFGSAMAFLTGPIGMVILAIGAVIAAVVVLVKNWDKIKEGAAAIWEATCEIFSEAWETIKEVFSKIGDWFSDRWNDIKKAFSAVGTWFSDIFTTAVDGIKSVFSAIGSWFSDRWNDITSVFSGVGEWFAEKFSNAYEKIKSVFSGIAEWAGGIWDTIKGAFTALGESVGEAVGGAIKTVVNGILTTIENTINGFFDFINGAIDLINDIPGVDIPHLSGVSLPRLAQGGFVEANTPQLAVVGDNRHEGEIIAPESKISEAVSAGMLALLPRMAQIISQAIVKSNNGNAGSYVNHMIMELDGQVLYEAYEQIKRSNDGRSGGRA